MAANPSNTFKPNDQIGPYIIQEFRAQGGMGAVYRARDPKLQRDVALKVLFPHLASDRDFLARFRREAVLMAQLTHPNIVQVYDADVDGNAPYLAMEFVPGATLFQQLKTLHARNARMPERDALLIVRQIASALDYAHQKGLVHRDVKPSNIMQASTDRHVLTDFGISFDTAATRLTRTISAVGTPEYMSPEAGQGLAVDGRSDIYSLGIVLFELLSGRTPFNSDSALGMVYMHAHEPLPNITRERNDLNKTTLRILERATAKQPAQRFQNAGDLVRAIDVALGVAHDSQSIWASGGGAVLQASQPRVTPSSSLRAQPKAAYVQPASGGGGVFVKLAVAVGALAVALIIGLAAAFSGIVHIPGLSPERVPGETDASATVQANAVVAATSVPSGNPVNAQATTQANDQRISLSVQQTSIAIGTQVAAGSQSALSTQSAVLAGLQATQNASRPTATSPAPAPTATAAPQLPEPQTTLATSSAATAVAAARATVAARPTAVQTATSVAATPTTNPADSDSATALALTAAAKTLTSTPTPQPATATPAPGDITAGRGACTFHRGEVFYVGSGPSGTVCALWDGKSGSTFFLESRGLTAYGYACLDKSDGSGLQGPVPSIFKFGPYPGRDYQRIMIRVSPPGGPQDCATHTGGYDEVIVLRLDAGRF